MAKKHIDEILIFFYERGQNDFQVRASAGLPLSQCKTSLEFCKNYFEDLKRESTSEDKK